MCNLLYLPITHYESIVVLLLRIRILICWWYDRVFVLVNSGRDWISHCFLLLPFEHLIMFSISCVCFIGILIVWNESKTRKTIHTYATTNIVRLYTATQLFFETVTRNTLFLECRDTPPLIDKEINIRR